jgi:thiol-disulfide isomerase/thioredoxin
MTAAVTRRGVIAGLALLPLAGRGAGSETFWFRRGSWQALLSSHAGRPLIVHFWGLTCGPCLTELADWGRFHAAHPNLALVLINADPIPQRDEGAAGALVKAGLADVEAWSFQDRFTERLFWEVDPAWQGELPYTVLVGRAGARTPSLGQSDFSAIDAWAKSEGAAPA